MQKQNETVLHDYNFRPRKTKTQMHILFLHPVTPILLCVPLFVIHVSTHELTQLYMHYLSFLTHGH